MKTLRNIWYIVIHSVRMLLSRIWGHNRKGNVLVNGEELSMEQFMERFGPPKPANCQLSKCGQPLKVSRGQVVKYHPYCRKFRHNTFGFDPSKVNV